MTPLLKTLILSFIIFNLSQGAKAQREGITLFAAASLRGPLKEIITHYQKNHPGRVRTNFASSGHLARQLEQGAPADLYLSASQKWMDYAKDNHTIDTTTIIYPIKNSLVLISPRNHPLIQVQFKKTYTLTDHFNGKFSIADPSHVPAGAYTKEAMEKLGWWNPIKDRLIRGKDVRQALYIVEKGEVQLGTVYQSDAITSKQVQILGKYPPHLHSPIIYACGQCTQSQNKKEGKIFLTNLQSPESQKIFQKYGFQCNHD